MANSISTRPAYWIGLLLVLLTLGTYWPVFQCDFVNYDDQDYVTENVYVRQGVSWAGLGWAMETSRGGYWLPVTWVSHMLDWQLYGATPSGHHATSLVFHIVNTLLLFGLLTRITGALWRSAVVACLFALHPLHVESVAWISERKDVLSALFFLLALLVYAKYVNLSTVRNSERKTYYLATLALFVLGLMSKPMVLTLPCVMLLLDYWPLRRWSHVKSDSQMQSLASLIVEKLPFFIFGMISILITFLGVRKAGAVAEIGGLPFSDRLANGFVSYVRYMAKTLWPAKLSPLYLHPGHWPIDVSSTAGLVVLIITVAVVALARRRPYLCVGWFWFVGMLVPVIGLLQAGPQAMADRYTYLPLIGLFVLVTWGAADLLGGQLQHRGLLGAIALVAVVACVPVTWAQLQHWKNSESLFRHVINVTSNNYVAYCNLGASLYEQGRLPEAIALLGESLRINPRHLEAHNNMALALAKTGKLEEATTHYAAMLAIDPQCAAAHYGWASLLDQLGRLDEAVTHYQAAIQLRPDYVEAYNNLGGILAAQDRWPEATGLFLTATQIKPSFAEAHNNLGSAKMALGQLGEAAGEFKMALQLKPDYADARINMGKALFYQNSRAEAVRHFEAALRLRPDSIEALDLLARILASSTSPNLRRGTEAVRLAARAVELTKTNHPGTLDTLAVAYAEVGRFRDAANVARVAAELAVAAGQNELATEIQNRRQLYAAGRVFRE